MEDNCGVDMSGLEVLPTSTGADCNRRKDPDASYVFVAGNGAVAEELADGKSEPIEKLGSLDLEVSNDAAELGVAHGGSPMKNGLSPSDEIGGENGASLAFQAEKDKVHLGKVVEQRKESQVNDLESHSENVPLVVGVNGEKAEEDQNIGSNVTEESHAISIPDIVESEKNHIAESEQDELDKAQVVTSNNNAESEQSHSGEYETISTSNHIAEAEHIQSGKSEVSSSTVVGELELSQTGNTEDMVEDDSKKGLVSNIEENQDSSTSFTEDIQDDGGVNLNHGKESLEITNNAPKDLQETSEMELLQNMEAPLCVVEAGVKLETVEVSDVGLLANRVNGLSDGCAEDDVAETVVANGIAAAPQTTPLQNGGSEELGRSENSLSEAEVSTSYPATSAGESIEDSKSEFDMPVVQVGSGAINGHVACQNGETLPTDHVEEYDSQADFSHSSQTSPNEDMPSEVSETVLADDVSIAKYESNPVDPFTDTAILQVDDGFSCPSDATFEPVVDNGYSHPIHDCETREAREVDEKFIEIPSASSNDAIPEIESGIIAIKFGEFPALSSHVVNAKSEVLTEAANDIRDGSERESCSHDLVENAVDVRANSEAEDAVVVHSEFLHDNGAQSESVPVENTLDVTTESQGGRTHNGVKIENKENQLVGVYFDGKTSEEMAVANADSQGEAWTSSLEGIDGQNLVTEGDKRPFYYLIKIPRYDNGENLREQIKHAEDQVDEKTKSRDVIRTEMQKQRACCNEFGARLDDAISEENAARDWLKAKRKEIDSVLLVINQMRSAQNVGEIDSKIRDMEYMLQHETLALKDEKNYIRMIQQLKQTREQLSSSLAKQEGVQEALNKKEQVEEHLKALKKEADQLRENVSKAEGATKVANKKYQDEKAKLNDLTMQFKAADDVRQKAYADLRSLRQQLYDKNKYFYKYKNDSKAAYDLASNGDKDELQSHCIIQVERVMELWNNNDEFRQAYVRCNIRSALRRLRTLDGRSLGPDEEPPVIPYVAEQAAKKQNICSISILEEENTVAPVKKTEKKHDESPRNLRDQIKPAVNVENPAKPAPSANGFATLSQTNEKEEALQQEENKLRKEEAELIKKAEELRKEEVAASFRGQRRLEEKAKAKEAMERKKRNADKAQARAALRAQKEAEQKEKEREKRARKKEKLKTVEEQNVVNEAESGLSPEIPKVSEPVEKPITQTKRSLKPSQFTKQLKPKPSMPLPLRNRSKRRMQTWMWAPVAVLVMLAVFLLGNAIANGNFSLQRLGF